MSKTIQIQHKGVTIIITPTTALKKGVAYQSYQMADYSSGKRRRLTFADLDEAKAKAREIAEAKGGGQNSLLALAPLEAAIQSALETLTPTRTRIDKAALIFAQCCEIVEPSELVSACRYWREKQVQKITPICVGKAVDGFLARQKGRVSIRRHKTNTTYLRAFGRMFGSRVLSELWPLEISDWANSQLWARKTRNDVLSTVSLLYCDAIQRGLAMSNPADAKSIKREKLRGGTVGIFTPDEGRRILNSVNDELKPFLACWFFSLLRKEEAARLSWAQISQGLASGSIYLSGDETKTGQSRSVPIPDNLRLWLMRYRKSSGPVLPVDWQGRDETHRIQRLDDLVQHVQRRSGVPWKANGPRHSSITYALTASKDPVATAKQAGTSLLKIQRHYWCRAETVTVQTAAQWFAITPPPVEENVVSMPKAETAAAESAMATAAG